MAKRPIVPKKPIEPQTGPEAPALLDREYVVLKATRGYRRGDVLRNWPRSILRTELDAGNVGLLPREEPAEPVPAPAEPEAPEGDSD